MGKCEEKKMSGAAESETHDPKTKRKENPKPLLKKKTKLKCTRRY